MPCRAPGATLAAGSAAAAAPPSVARTLAVHSSDPGSSHPSHPKNGPASGDLLAPPSPAPSQSASVISEPDLAYVREHVADPVRPAPTLCPAPLPRLSCSARERAHLATQLWSARQCACSGGSVRCHCACRWSTLATSWRAWPRALSHSHAECEARELVAYKCAHRRPRATDCVHMHSIPGEVPARASNYEHTHTQTPCV